MEEQIQKINLIESPSIFRERYLSKQEPSLEPKLVGAILAGNKHRWVANVYTDPIGRHNIALTPRRQEAKVLELEDVKVIEEMFEGMTAYYRVDTFDTDITYLIKRQI